MYLGGSVNLSFVVAYPKAEYVCPNSFMDILKRVRTDPAIVAYGLYLYFNSRSYRLASKSLEPLQKRTHVAIWKWVGTEIF